jgi:hypothetical protein
VDLANNALKGLAGSLPKFDLVGPTVDHEIRRVISRYGADAVKDAVKRQTKPKRGRRPEMDWPELTEVIELDARELLAGGDPFSTRSNYSIAKGFADKNPGQSHPATMKRIERKLFQKRRNFALAIAQTLSREGYPYAVHIRALEALIEAGAHPVWTMTLDQAKSDIADYEAKKGEPPPAELSMAEVEDAARNVLLSLAVPEKSGGLLGLLSPYAPNSERQE